MKTITLHGLALEQRAKGFQVAKRKASKKGVFQKPVTETLRPNVPNSVFTLGQSMFVSTAKA
jgi:hypothetical protein